MTYYPPPPRPAKTLSTGAIIAIAVAGFLAQCLMYGFLFSVAMTIVVDEDTPAGASTSTSAPDTTDGEVNDDFSEDPDTAYDQGYEVGAELAGEIDAPYLTREEVLDICEETAQEVLDDSISWYEVSQGCADGYVAVQDD